MRFAQLSAAPLDRRCEMDMSLMIVEVDGSIRNPAVAIAVGTWVVVITGFAFGAGRRYRSNRRTRSIVVLVLLTLATPVAVKVVATLIYLVPEGKVFAVHFWGMTRLQWLAVPAAVVAFSLASRSPDRKGAAV